ncbi:STAS domain-containing protein [Streptomyces sp. NRRL F-5630]|uniref:STAS domain-containing protein n=2 Tax=Streptomyces sp. NRRL F-5630 TaxID=1463864 RepID=UPI00068D1280
MRTIMPADTTPTDAVLVVPFDGLVDLDNEEETETALFRTLDRVAARLVVVHIRSRIVTPQALRVLLRARTRAGERGTVLCVAAPFPVARRVLHLTGLARRLRLAATVTGAVRRASGGGACAHLATLPAQRAGEEKGSASRRGGRRTPRSNPN